MVVKGTFPDQAKVKDTSFQRADFLELSDYEMRALARIIRAQEVRAVLNNEYSSQIERRQMLEEIKKAHDMVIELLDHGEAAVVTYSGDSAKEPIASDIYGLIRDSINSAVQYIRNFNMRIQYVSKLKASANEKLLKLDALDPDIDYAEIKKLANLATEDRNAGYLRNRALMSRTSEEFQTWLSKSGLSFEELIKRYTSKLFGDAKPFRRLSNLEKVQVYEEIIRASGRSHSTTTYIKGAAGIAFVLFSAGMVVWDIFSSAHPISEGLKQGVLTAAGVAGEMLGELATTSMASAVAGAALVGEEATSLIVAIAGFAGGFAGCFIVGAAVAALFALIVATGAFNYTKHSLSGIKVHVVQLPDGKVLARQLKHQLALRAK